MIVDDDADGQSREVIVVCETTEGTKRIKTTVADASSVKLSVENQTYCYIYSPDIENGAVVMFAEDSQTVVNPESGDLGGYLAMFICGEEVIHLRNGTELEIETVEIFGGAQPSAICDAIPGESGTREFLRWFVLGLILLAIAVVGYFAYRNRGAVDTSDQPPTAAA